MSIADDLKDAIRVPIAIGQLVVVRSQDGSRVASGWVRDVDPATGVVRVRDDASGTDVQIDVDGERYKLWVQVPTRMLNRLGKQQALYIHPSRPGTRMSRGSL